MGLGVLVTISRPVTWVRGRFRYDRIKPSISLSAQLIASSKDCRCCVTLAINFVKVAWANIWVPILKGAGYPARLGIASWRGG